MDEEGKLCGGALRLRLHVASQQGLPAGRVPNEQFPSPRFRTRCADPEADLAVSHPKVLVAGESSFESLGFSMEIFGLPFAHSESTTSLGR